MRSVATFLVILCLAGAAHADERINPVPFGLWVEQLRTEAISKGIDPAVFDAALYGVAPLPNVIAEDRAQPERELTPDAYLERTVTWRKIDRAREAYDENFDLLQRVGAAYGVEPQYIVALWGMESDFGQHAGHDNVIAALATLAYDARRSAFFRAELLDALLILQQQRIPPEAMQGSWAGAMGQCQFMPSSYLRYAVDFDGDGRKDIWNDRADVFASIANYLASEGWNAEAGWPHNFQVLLTWNRSRYFAAAVGMLARDIAEGS